MTLGFIASSVAAFVLVSVVLVVVRRRLSLEAFWYGLAAIGAACAVVGYVAAMGGWLAWSALFAGAQEVPRSEAMGRADVMLATTFGLALCLETAKSFGVTLFHTRLNRGMWPVFGAAVGAGAGLLQLFWVLASRSYTAVVGTAAIEPVHFWLVGHYVALTALEAACGALLLYHTAKGKRVLGIGLAAGLHGLGLFFAVLCAQAPDLRDLPWLSTVAVAATAALTTGIVVLWIKRAGWPY